MDQQAKERFDRANAKVHPVESQWHHPILTAAGFVPQTKEATGFVRTYEYAHPDGRKVACTTGMSSDYWIAGTRRSIRPVQAHVCGYWSDLAEWCKSSAT